MNSKHIAKPEADSGLVKLVVMTNVFSITSNTKLKLDTVVHMRETGKV